MLNCGLKTLHKSRNRRGTRELLEVMDIFITLFMWTVSWMYVYVQTHQIYTLYMYNFLYTVADSF